MGHRTEILCCFLVAVATTNDLLAQPIWLQSYAPPESSASFCYDPLRDQMVYVHSGTATREKQGLNGGWILRFGTGTPAPTPIYGGIAYDRNRRRVVCNGYGPTTRLETYEWDGTNWELRQGGVNWAFHHFVGHTRRGTVMAFGGTHPYLSNDLYEWDGSSWILVPAVNKPPRPEVGFGFNRYWYYYSAAYDERRDKIVLFGSGERRSTNDFPLSWQPEVWEWDGTVGWTSRMTTTNAVTAAGPMFFDSHRGVLVALVQDALAQMRVIEWDGGSTWQDVTPDNSPNGGAVSRVGHDSLGGLSYVTLITSTLPQDHPLMYLSAHRAMFEPLGPGCPGTAGEPVLRLTENWTRAWIGGQFSVDLTSMPTTPSMGFVLFGWSNTSVGGVSLPLALDSLGMPGCVARVSNDLLCPIVGANGTARLVMTVPSDNALVGAVLYEQGISLDPLANAAGIAVSNAVRVTIGRL